MTEIDGNPPHKNSFVPPGARNFALLLLILLLAAFLRFRDLNYSTAFVDEASFVRVGEAILSHPLEAPYSQPLNFMFGWYLWPALAAVGEWFGGLAGVRAVSAAMGTLTILGVYLFSRELFGEVVAISAAAVFALLGPAVHISRLGSYDATAVCFLSFGLWLYARAWRENSARLWLGSGLFFFLSFLAKYFVALYFPLLILAAFRKGKKALLWLALPLAVLCGAFLLIFLDNMRALIRFGQHHIELTAPTSQLSGIYVSGRIDFWVLFLLALFSWFRWQEVKRSLIPLVWLGACVLVAFQWWSRADYNTWKHVNYPLLFIVPLAMAGLEKLLSWTSVRQSSIAMPALVLPLAVTLGWTGLAFQPRQFAFWPDVSPIVRYMDSRSAAMSRHRILADDLVFQFYYFDKSLRATQTTSPYFFRYGGLEDARAYAAAVRDGVFDFVVFDGWAAPKSIEMRDAVRPVLAQHYAPRLDLPVRQMGGRLEVYERTQPSRFFPLVSYWKEHVDAKSWVLLENPDIRLHLEPYVSVQRVFDFSDFRYGDLAGLAATMQAVRERFFSYLVLRGRSRSTDEAKRAELLAAVNANYELQGRFRDDFDGLIELYAVLPPGEGTLRLEIEAPRSGELVRAQGIETMLRGRVLNAPPGWLLRAEVFTNRWYPQGEAFAPAADGSFAHTIYLGGPCEHLVRVTLYDEKGSRRASASSYGVTRANSDGTAPTCP